MKSIIKSVVKSIQSKTGIDIDVFDLLGNMIASTEGIKKQYSVCINMKNFIDGVFCDKESGMTNFIISSNYNTYIGVLQGIDEISKNYSYMLSTLVENALARLDSNLSRNDSIKAILLGETTKEQVDRYVNKFSIPKKACYVMLVHILKDKHGEVFNLLSQYAQGVDETIMIDDHNLAYIKFYDKDDESEGILTFAETLHSSIINELNAKCIVGVGTAISNVQDLSRSYYEANAAVRMSKLISDREGVFSYREYILLKILEDIPKEKLRQYMDILFDAGAQEILSDASIMATGEEFLNTSLNISETSKNMYMHRNTLVYKLDKIEKSMGLNIRRFSDAVTFRIITMIYKMLKK